MAAAMSGPSQQKADPATGMYAPPAASAVTLVSASKLVATSNVGFLTSDGKPRQPEELDYNIWSGGFGEVVVAVAGKSTDIVDYVRWAQSDPSGPGDEIYGLGTLGDIASDTLSLDADSRLAVSYPTSTGGTVVPAELPFAIQMDSLEDWCFAAAAMGVK